MHSFLYDYEENHKAELNQYLSEFLKENLQFFLSRLISLSLIDFFLS